MFNKRESVEIAEAGLEDALKNFRSSVHAWSETEFTRPRAVLLAEHRQARHMTWRTATAWALGCALAAGSLSAGIYEHHHHDQLARMAAQRAAAESALQQRQPAAAQAPADTPAQDEKLMAAVDQDVSQEVPSAMEPLAQLMNEGAYQ